LDRRGGEGGRREGGRRCTGLKKKAHVGTYSEASSRQQRQAQRVNNKRGAELKKKLEEFEFCIIKVDEKTRGATHKTFFLDFFLNIFFHFLMFRNT
jgi:hypothetical protein